MSHPAENLFTCVMGPIVVCRRCNVCGYMLQRRRGGRGRGAGFREGNKHRGEMIQHIKAQHAQELASQ